MFPGFFIKKRLPHGLIKRLCGSLLFLFLFLFIFRLDNGKGQFRQLLYCLVGF